MAISLRETIASTQAKVCQLDIETYNFLDTLYDSQIFKPPTTIKSFLKFRDRFTSLFQHGVRSLPNAVLAYFFLTLEYLGLDSFSLLDKTFTAESVTNKLPIIKQLISSRFLSSTSISDLVYNYEVIRLDPLFSEISKEFANFQLPDKHHFTDYFTTLYSQLPIDFSLQSEMKLRNAFPLFIIMNQGWVDFKQKVKFKVLPHYDYRLLLLASEAAGIFLDSNDENTIKLVSAINSGLNDLFYFFHFCWKYMDILQLKSFVYGFRNNFGVPDASKLIMKYLEFLSDVMRDIIPLSAFSLHSKELYRFFEEYISVPYGSYKHINGYLKDFLKARAGKKSSQVVVFITSRLGNKSKQYLPTEIFSNLNQKVKQVVVVTQDEADVLFNEGSAVPIV